MGAKAGSSTRAGALFWALVFSLGALAAPVNVLPAIGHADAAAAPAPAGPSAPPGVAGPGLPPIGSVDLSGALGLSPGALLLDGKRLDVFAASAGFLVRHGLYHTYPLGPMPAQPAITRTAAQIAASIGVDPRSLATLALWDHAAAQSDPGQALAALDAYDRALQLDRAVRSGFGHTSLGVDGFLDLMRQEGAGAQLTPAQVSLVLGRVGGAMAASIADAYPAALTQVGFAAGRLATAPQNPWHPLAGTPFSPDLPTAVTGARGIRGVTSVLPTLLGSAARPAPASAFEPAVQHLARSRAVPLSPDDLSGLHAYAAGLTPAQDAALGSLVEAMAQGQELVRAAYQQLPFDLLAASNAELTPDVLQQLALHQSTGSAAPPNTQALLDVLQKDAPGILAQVTDALQPVLAAADALQGVDFGTSASATPNDHVYAFPDEVLPFGNPFGSFLGPSGPLLVIGTTGDDTNPYNGLLMVDPAGNDRYTGAGLGSGYGSLSFVVDVAGNDVYTSECSYGSGVGGGYIGVGGLVDFQGDDLYQTSGCYASLGTGFEGVGFFYDQAGDDTYRVELATSGNALGGGYAGVGVAVDAGGNDVYEVSGAPASGALGAAGLVGGLGAFVDLHGDDRYTVDGSLSGTQPTVALGATQPLYFLSENVASGALFADTEGNDRYTLQGKGFGYGPGNVALFADTDGTDVYDTSYTARSCSVTATASCSPGNNKQWLGQESNFNVLGYVNQRYGWAGFGVDTDLKLSSTAAGAPVGDVAALVLSPRSNVQAALGDTITFTVAAENRGSTTVPSVKGAWAVTARSDDKTPGQPLGSSAPPNAPTPIDFGDVPANGRVLRNVTWTSNSDVRKAQFAFSLASPSDTDPQDNVATLAFTTQDVKEVTVKDLYVTTSGKVGPGADVSPHVTLLNCGNVAYASLPVTFLLTPADGGDPAVTKVVDVALPRPSPIHDTGCVPTSVVVPFSFTAPDAGEYVARASVPADNNAFPDRTFTEKPVLVIDQLDRAVAMVPRNFLVDPDLFNANGATFEVRNTGTRPLAASTVAFETTSGARRAASSANVPALAPDEAATFQAPALAGGAATGQTWTFSAQLPNQAGESNLTNNKAEQVVTFLPGIVRAEDFELPSSDIAPVANTQWTTGTKTVPAQPAPWPAGPTAWGTGFDGPLPRNAVTNYDLVVRNIDLSSIIDGRLTFAHTMHSPDGQVQYNYYGPLGSVAVSPAGSDAWQRIEPDGGYPCRSNYSHADNGPGFCLSAGWKTSGFDVSAYDGQRVDLRFRVSTSSMYRDERGWTIDDLRVSGVQRVDGDLQVLKLDPPSPALKGRAGVFVATVRNNGFSTISGADLTIRAQVGTRGPVSTLTAAHVPALAPLQTALLNVSWTPALASPYVYTVDLTTPVADPRPSNGHLTGTLPVYDPIAVYDLDTTDPSKWTLASDSAPADWTLSAPGDGEFPSTAFSGTKVWTTNANGAYAASTSRNSWETLQAPRAPAVTGHTPGDAYALMFEHGYDIQTSYESDGVYVTAEVNGQQQELYPAGGYPDSLTYYYTGYGSPPDLNGVGVWNGRTPGYVPAVLPIPDVKDGDVIAPRFNLFSNYYTTSGGGSDHTGWTVDDPMIVRLPRFDHNLEVKVVGPRILDLGHEAEVPVLVHNTGRLASAPFTVDVTLSLIGHDPVRATAAWSTPIPPGETRTVKVPVVTPGDAVGAVQIAATANWGLDEYALDDTASLASSIAAVLYQNDFEENGGGFNAGGAGGFTYGARPDGPNIQGSKSWYTGALGSGADVELHGPAMKLSGPGSLRFPHLALTGGLVFSINPCDGEYSYSQYRLADEFTDEPILMEPGSLQSVYQYYRGSFDPSQCSVNPVGDPLEFTADLTGRQSLGSFKPLFQGHNQYFFGSSVPNSGMEVDDLALAGVPRTRDVALSPFLSPADGLLGPGEEVPVTIQAVGGGVSWPDGSLAVHLFSNDQLGSGGRPSFEATVPIPRLPYGTVYNVSALWTPPVALDGQVVTLRAELLRVDGTPVALADEDLSNNVRQLAASILSVHHVKLDVTADPNVDPDAVPTVNLRAVVSNLGTRTEDNVRVALTMRDDGDHVVQTLAFPTVQKRPDRVQGPQALTATWTPPGPGRYRVDGVLSYPLQALDTDASQLQARTAIYAAALPDRLGDDFDGPDPLASGWHAEGGQAANAGFHLVDDAADARDGRGVLETGPYAPGLHVAYDLAVPLPSGAAAQLTFQQRRGLGPGDVATVQSSLDDGASWSELARYTGSSGWTASAVGLTQLAGHGVLLRFVLDAAGTAGGTGWRLDDVKVVAAGVPVLQRGFEDPLGTILQAWDFESASDEGWTHGADAPSGGTTGIDDWAHGVPAPAAHVTPHSGTRAWKTNLAGDYTPPCDSYTYSQVGPSCNSPDNSVGVRRLTSPPIQVPVGKQQVSLSWWQWVQAFSGNGYCYSFGCYGTMPDLAGVQVSVNGGAAQPVATTTGYGTRSSSIPGGLGWSGDATGWTQQVLDLTPYAGQTVAVTYVLGTTQDSYYRWHASPRFSPGEEGGFAIDDVRVEAKDASTGAADTAVAAIDVGDVLANTAAQATIRLARTVADGEADLHVAWIGANGAALPGPADSHVDLPVGLTSVAVNLGAVPSQATRLTVVATTTSGGDANALDDRLDRAVPVLRTLLRTGFDGGSACGAAKPCQGWTHSADMGADEWEQGAVPAAKWPSAAHSPSFVYATDLTTNQKYEVTERMTLTAPALAIPEGAFLKFSNAMESDCSSSYSCDGGTVLADGAVLKPDGGYTKSDCGYYANYLPCYAGKYDWTPVRVDLGSLAGHQNVKLQFTFASDSTDSTPGKAGWSLDDVLVAALPVPPTADTRLVAPPQADVDPRQSDAIPLTVQAPGSDPSPPGKVLAQWYRQGVALGGPLSLGYPGLPAGGNWALAAPLPDGPADGLTLVARLADTSGAPLADGDPADDVATVALTASRVLATLGADSPALVMGDPGAPGFVVAAPPTATGAPKQAIVAGLGISPLAPAQSLVLGPVYLGGDDVLAFRQFARFGPGDGAFVQGSSDGGLTWTTLDPQGGYPTTGGQDMKCSDSDRSARCTTTSGGWQDVRVGLSALAGSQALLRVAYHAAATGRDGGLALADLRILGPAGGDATLGAARWAVGPIHNPAGPLEEASQPNAWGTGLEAKSARSRAFDVLASAPVDSHAMQDPVLSFDWYGVPEDGARLLAQARDPLGNWRTIGQLTGPTSVWEHVAFPLGAVGDVTQVRLLATTPGGKPGGAKAGYFVDDLLVGSLRGELTPVLDGFHVTPGDPVPALEASTFTVPVRLVNAGAFTNRYRLEARGVDPQWVTVPGPAITLAPGEAVTTSVGVRIPYVRDEGVYPLVLVARSLFDPLQQATADLLVNLKVAPKPDYVVKRVDFQSSFASPGDPVRHVEDAKPNTIVAEVENVGRASSTRDLDVLFLEHYANGDVRPIDTAVVPTSNLTSPDEPHHAPYGAFVEWFPRKGVVGIEVIANPDSLGNPIPLNPESSFANNAAFTPVAIEPRPLPELTLAAPPGFSRLPQVGQAVTIGVDVRNGGNAPTANPVDVAVLANPQDAFLESPAFRIPSHSLLRLEYSSDLETRADGFVVEMKDDGASAYERIAPTGGYPNGCLSGLLCQSGVSGRADHRVLTFDLSGHEGTVQLRLRFAMDSHNGRTYDGLRLHALRIQQFASTPVSFDFGQSSSGWTAGPTYTGRDGNAATVWQYSPREGVVPGAWTIPTGYLNPYLVALKPVKPIPTGNLEHVDLDWVPQAGGDTPLVVLIDPKNLEPEFLDDLNHNDAAVRVAVSGFAIQTTHTAGCPATVNLCLPDAAATADFPVQLANTGNTRAAFDVKLREHPFLEAQLLVQGRPVTSVELDPGATLDAVLHVHAVAAPADLHVLQVDVTDRLVGKASKVGIPVQVLSGATGASPAKLTGDLAFNVVASAKRVLTLENPTNKAIPVLLRSGAKPSGLALSLQPNEFTLAPFESRTVQLELLNLGVVAGPYTVPIVNSRVACPSGSAATCGEVGELAVKVAAYAPPRGDFTVVDAHPRPNIPVRFRDASTATGSTVTGWSWDFGDGATSTDADPSHTYLRPGLYQVRLTVTDAEGQEGPAEDQTVAVANDPPTALAALLSPKPLAGHLLNFSALGSLDADGGIAKVTWAFGDGGLGLGVNTTHTYRSPGTYHVTVAVEDLFGAVTLKEMQVTVASADAVNEAAASSGSNGSPAPVAVFALAVLLACALVRRRRA